MEKYVHPCGCVCIVFAGLATFRSQGTGTACAGKSKSKSTLLGKCHDLGFSIQYASGYCSLGKEHSVQSTLTAAAVTFFFFCVGLFSHSSVSVVPAISYYVLKVLPLLSIPLLYSHAPFQSNSPASIVLSFAAVRSPAQWVTLYFQGQSIPLPPGQKVTSTDLKWKAVTAQYSNRSTDLGCRCMERVWSG